MIRRTKQAVVLVVLMSAAPAVYLRADGKNVDEKQPNLSLSLGERAGVRVPQTAAERARVRVPEAVSPLPPRALLRIGSEDGRTEGSITSIAFSPDGRIVAAAVANSNVLQALFFDVRTGRQVRVLTPAARHAGSVLSVAFAPDGRKLIWGEETGHVALWDVLKDRILFRDRLHQDSVSDVLFSPDGTVMATAGEDDVVHLRRVENPEVAVQQFISGESALVRPRIADPPGAPFPAGPFQLAFTPDGASLVVGSDSRGSISIWRIKDGQLVRTLEQAHGDRDGSDRAGLHYVAATADGRRIVSAGGSRVPIKLSTHKYGHHHARFAEVRVWDMQTGDLVRDLHHEEDHGFGYAALSSDGKHVAVADLGVLRILAVESGELEREFALPGFRGNPPVYSPDGTLVAMPIFNSLAFFDVRAGQRLHHAPGMPEGNLITAAWSPSGDRIVTGHGDSGVRVWQATTGKLLWQKLFAPDRHHTGWHAYPIFVAYSSDGKTVVTAGRREDPVGNHSGSCALYEAESGRTIREVELQELNRAALSPDGRMLVVAASKRRTGATRLVGVDLTTGEERWTNPPIELHPGSLPVQALRFRANSPAFVAAYRDGSVVSYNSLTGIEQRRFLADCRTPDQKRQKFIRPNLISEGTFSADGSVFLASASDPSNAQAVYRWDVETGKLRRRTRYPYITGARTLSPDGKTLATVDFLTEASRGLNLIRLYDVETSEHVLELDPGDNRVSVLELSPDGSKLLSGFSRGSAIVWDVRRPGTTANRE